MNSRRAVQRRGAESAEISAEKAGLQHSITARGREGSFNGPIVGQRDTTGRTSYSRFFESTPGKPATPPDQMGVPVDKLG
jgi:hypothetical protein